MSCRFPVFGCFAMISLACSGCIAIGNGHSGEMSIADEIQELKEARDHGKLTHDEFHLGIAALHSRAH